MTVRALIVGGRSSSVTAGISLGILVVVMTA